MTSVKKQEFNKILLDSPDNKKINETSFFNHKSIAGLEIKDGHKVRHHPKMLQIMDKVGAFYKKHGGLNKALTKFANSTKELSYDTLIPFQDTISPKKVKTKLDGKDNNKHLPVVFRINGENILEGGTHRTVADIISGKTSGKFIYIDLDNK